MAGSGERVQRVVRVERQLHVVGQVIGLRARLAHDLAVAALAVFPWVRLAVDREIDAGARRYGTGHVGVVLNAEVGTQAEKAIVGQLKALVHRRLTACAEVAFAAHAVFELAVQGAAAAARAVAFEDDVDHPGNRIRAVLRCRAVT